MNLIQLTSEPLERPSKEIPANNPSNETSGVAYIPGDQDTRRKIAARNAIVSCAKRDGLLARGW